MRRPWPRLPRATLLAVWAFAAISMLAAPSAVALATAAPSAPSAPGGIWSWGRNDDGQLGAGIPSGAAQRVAGLDQVQAIAAGGAHALALALAPDGTVWAWGSNLYGQLGSGGTEAANPPAQVVRLSDVAAVAAGGGHSLALRQDGTVWGWGSNALGQIGDGTTIDRGAPTLVEGLDQVVAIAAGPVGPHSLALRADGTVWGWGENFWLAPQDNQPIVRTFLTPTRIEGLEGVSAIATGVRHALARTSDGSLWAWGRNCEGQLGNGAKADCSTLNASGIVAPAPVSGLGPVSAFAAGDRFSLAATEDGAVWGWGIDSFGQLGGGTRDSSNVAVLAPRRVVGFDAPLALAAGQDHSLGLAANGAVWSWGANLEGELGNGSRAVPSASPVPAIGVGQVIAISASRAHSLALREDGSVWEWGGALVNARAVSSPRPQPAALARPNDVVAIATSTSHNLALRADGSLWAWGWNAYGQLGSGTTISAGTPIRVTALSGVAAVDAGAFHSLALLTDGTVWSWGRNCCGELGSDALNGLTANPTPRQVPGIDAATAVAAGTSHSLVLRADGSVWSWGDAGFGQLGDPRLESRHLPARIEGLDEVIAIAAADMHSFALRADGTVWAWGRNAEGELGLGSVSEEHCLCIATPTRITDLDSVVAIASGARHALALRQDGSVWAWGTNRAGQLGDGTQLPRPAPVQVPNLTEVTAIAAGAGHSLALRADGTLWAWGDNRAGQLGADASVDRRSSPSQVMGVEQVTAIDAGELHTLAIRPPAPPG